MNTFSKILSYVFALIVIATTGLIILIITTQDKVSTGDWILIFCLLLIMLMGLYYIANDIKTMLIGKQASKHFDKEVGILDEDLL